MSFAELLASVGEKLTRMQQWQRELSGLRACAVSESGAIEVEVDACGQPSQLSLDPAALRLSPADLGRQLVEMFDAAAAGVDARRAEIDRELAAETAGWARPAAGAR